MNKNQRRKPTAFRVEEVEVFVPPAAPERGAEPVPLPRARAMPDLGRGLRWGSIFLGALAALVSLIASIWLYDWVVSLIARDDWIGWLAAAAIGEAPFALAQAVADHWFGRFILFGYTWALFHHMLGGIRHFIWDTGAGYGPMRYVLAWATLIGSLAITATIWLWVLS